MPPLTVRPISRPSRAELVADLRSCWILAWRTLIEPTDADGPGARSSRARLRRPVRVRQRMRPERSAGVRSDRPTVRCQDSSSKPMRGSRPSSGRSAPLLPPRLRAERCRRRDSGSPSQPCQPGYEAAARHIVLGLALRPRRGRVRTGPAPSDLCPLSVAPERGPHLVDQAFVRHNKHRFAAKPSNPSARCSGPRHGPAPSTAG